MVRFDLEKLQKIQKSKLSASKMVKLIVSFQQKWFDEKFTGFQSLIIDFGIKVIKIFRILREINFGQFRVSKTAILLDLNCDFGNFRPWKIEKLSKIKSMFDQIHSLSIDFTKNCFETLDWSIYNFINFCVLQHKSMNSRNFDQIEILF